MVNNIFHSKPSLSDREFRAVEKVLKSGQLAMGSEVTAFEKEFVQDFGFKHVAAVNSGLSALHLALLALDIKAGDEVIIPSYTCAALLHAVQYVQATPVVVDVNETDFNISLESVQNSITPKTKAIIVVHSFGLPVDIRPFQEFDVPIVEDCAQALGAKCNGEYVGQSGVISTFSFYATKMMTTAEGGLVASADSVYMDKVRDLLEYDQKLTHKTRYNYKMSDVHAAIGREQLKKLPAFINRRQAIAQQYDQALSIEPFSRPQVDSLRDHVYFRYILKCQQPKQNHLIMKALNQNGIQSRTPVFQPLHQALSATRACPVAEQLMQTTISIPIYPSLGADDIKRITDQILTIAKNI